MIQEWSTKKKKKRSLGNFELIENFTFKFYNLQGHLLIHS